MVRISDIEVDEDVLKEAMRLAGTDEPRKALLEAMKEYTRPRTQKDLIKLLGTCDGFYTSEELEQLRSMD
jgi:Arc/MetJ family transcription regulator